MNNVHWKISLYSFIKILLNLLFSLLLHALRRLIFYNFVVTSIVRFFFLHIFSIQRCFVPLIISLKKHTIRSNWSDLWPFRGFTISEAKSLVFICSRVISLSVEVLLKWKVAVRVICEEFFFISLYDCVICW